MNMDSFLIPAVLCGITLYGLCKRVDVFGVFIEGAKEGLSTSVSIIPALVALMTCVGMLKASGALDFFTFAFSPVAAVLGLPKEVLPLAILRPVSGSGAMAVYQGILESFGPDSYIGRVASVIQGSTETTFYTIAVYCGAVKLTGTRHMLPAGLAADLAGFVMSAAMVRIFFN
jgi:spore maturation protein B